MRIEGGGGSRRPVARESSEGHHRAHHHHHHHHEHPNHAQHKGKSSFDDGVYRGGAHTALIGTKNSPTGGTGDGTTFV